MLATIIDDVSNIFHNVWNWFQTLTPGGFGLILIPLIILGTITILVSRNRYGRPSAAARYRRPGSDPVGARHLADHEPRVLAAVEPLVARLAHQPVAGPARELGPDHERGLDPRRAAEQPPWRGRLEWRGTRS